MAYAPLSLRYFAWHYSRAWSDGWHIFVNVLTFLARFFSLSEMTRTLIAPWRRMNERVQNPFDLADVGQTILVNLLMRAVGLVVRTTVIAMGILSMAVWMIVSFVTAVAWLFLPPLIVFLITASFVSLIRYAR